METLRAFIPAKKRLDVADDLGEEGVTVQIVGENEEGDLCVINVVGGTRETQSTIRDVLERHHLLLRDSDADSN